MTASVCLPQANWGYTQTLHPQSSRCSLGGDEQQRLLPSCMARLVELPLVTMAARTSA